MQRSYVLAPDKLRRILRRMFWRFQLIVTISFLGFGLFLARSGERVNWSFVLPMIGVIALAYFLVIFLYYRQQLRLLYSIRYELDGTGIIYRQIGQQPFRISRADITAVRESKEGLLVETTDPRISLHIPRGLAQSGDQDVRELLNVWCAITPALPAPQNPFLGILFVGAAAALLVVFATSNFWIVSPLVVFLVIFGIYTIRQMRSMPSARPGMARTYSIAFAFLVFVALMKSVLLAINLFFGG